MTSPSRLPLALTAAIAACASTPKAWSVPPRWKSEVIPFPLGFAPTLAHRGVEELRFPPGFLDEAAPDHWSYAFVWRLDDRAALDATMLGAELSAYFRGLLMAVDGDRHRATPDAIVASAVGANGTFTLSAHVIDTFGSAKPIDLVGSAKRLPCAAGSVWSFVLAPAGSPVRAKLDQLASTAACGQPVR